MGNPESIKYDKNPTLNPALIQDSLQICCHCFLVGLVGCLVLL